MTASSPASTPAARLAVRLTLPLLALAASGLFGLTALQNPAAPPPPNVPFTASSPQRYELPTTPAMLMPTALAVDSAGKLFIADGVHDRVVVFASDGRLRTVLTEIADQPLRRPVGVRLDPAGNLWIADTGNQRVVAVSPAGDVLHNITPGLTDPPPDITDALPTADGNGVWMVDNDNHRLLRFNFADRTIETVGREGVSLGQFYFPFALATLPNNDLLVSEALNARVQVLTPTGTPTAAIGSYGLNLGNFYRPKQVAVGPLGNVWVADGVLNVIQIFRPTGGLIDVLRGPDGAPLRLDAPCGLTFGPDGDLYVTELLPTGVRRFSITSNPRAIAETRRVRTSAAGTSQPQNCTLCHIDWVEPLASGNPSDLLDVPENDPEHPVVSREFLCLSCHDGSVDDSRERVWADHGHQIDIAPPADMTVADQLPLADGKIVCRTCHSAHTRGGSGNVIAEAVFLRVEGEPAELCRDCHAPYDQGPTHGMHPIGLVETPVPDQLLEAGAHLGANQGEITCVICHSGHGSTNDLLLVADDNSNDLCIACHEGMHAGRFIEDQYVPGHPPQPPLNADQLAVVRDIGGRTSDAGELICLSCHKMHSAESERFVLGYTLAGSDMCIRCHEPQARMVGSAHDLTTNHPSLENRHGLTVAEAGACSSCHLFHDYARELTPTALDTTGQCMTCHAEDRVAAASGLGPVNHPDTNCQECHNPHEVEHPKFLTQAPTDLCVECHADQAVLAGGPHDLTANPAAWPAASRKMQSDCLACHQPHGNARDGLWRAGLDQSAPTADAACIACHAESQWVQPTANLTVAASDQNGGPPARPVGLDNAMLHPHTLTAKQAAESGMLQPFLTALNGQAQLTCIACHNPHAGPENEKYLLRAENDDLCLACHTDAQTIILTNHRPAALINAGLDAAGCQPCHSVHGSPTEVTDKFLWPKDLAPPPTVSPTNAADAHCLACHVPGGPTHAPATATHPEITFVNPFPPDSPGYMPLYDEAGNIDPAGQFACQTCHLPHGRPDAAERHGLDEPATFAEANARKLQLRPYQGPNLCTSCHGADALRRYLYFHTPERRGGPIEPVPTVIPPG